MPVKVKEHLNNLNREVDRLLEKSRRDPLTNLYNIGYLRRKLSVSLEDLNGDGRKLALCFIDVDDMAKLNSRYSHSVCNKALIELAGIFEEAVNDGIVARFGGDEFCILLPKITGVGAVEQLVERIESKLTTPVKVKDNKIELRISIGIAIAPTHANRVDEMLHRGSLSMFEAKRKNKREKNHYYFHEIEEEVNKNDNSISKGKRKIAETT